MKVSYQNVTKSVILFAALLLSNMSIAQKEDAANAVVSNVIASPSLNSSLWQMALGLSLVLALIFLLTWLMKKVTGIQGTRGHIKIISAINIGAKERAVLVEVSGEQLLLGVASGSVSLLHKLEKPIIDPSTDFATSLKNASNKLKVKTVPQSKSSAD
jgi:flagellar protein FliO/FliZ